MEYYNAKEAMRLLKMPAPTFYRKAREGEIPSEGTRPNLRFPKPAIDTLVELKEKTNKKPRMIFRSPTNNEIWKSYLHTLTIYNENEIVGYKRILEWKEINPNMFRSVIENGMRVAGITLIPTYEHIALAILKGDLLEKDIPDEAIRQWTDPDISVYIPNISREISNDPEITEKDNRTVTLQRGRFLLKHTLLWVRELDSKYDIKSWYAYGATPEGVKLLEDLGFQSISGYDHAAYVMDSMSSNTRIRELLAKVDDFDVLIP